MLLILFLSWSLVFCYLIRLKVQHQLNAKRNLLPILQTQMGNPRMLSTTPFICSAWTCVSVALIDVACFPMSTDHLSHLVGSASSSLVISGLRLVSAVLV
jgi:hypothetical protein